MQSYPRFAELKTRSRVAGRTSQANRAERKTHVRQPVAVGGEPTATATTGPAGRRCRARAPEQSRSRLVQPPPSAPRVLAGTVSRQGTERDAQPWGKRSRKHP